MIYILYTYTSITHKHIHIHTQTGIHVRLSKGRKGCVEGGQGDL
jgi:hypothetical protein